MMRLLLLTAVLAISACSRSEPSTPSVSLDVLRAKAELYRTAAGDEFGYVHSKCDGLLFASLCKLAGGCEKADIYASESKTEPGRWYRNPSMDCFDLGQSRSDFSRDMLLGLLSYLYAAKDRDAVTRLLAHGASTDFVMGRYDGPDTLAGRALWIQLAPLARQIESRLGAVALATQQSDDAFVINTGFRAHLDVLKIWLDGKVNGGITEIQRRTLAAQTNRQPRNAMFLAVRSLYDGNEFAERAVGILSDTTLFPADTFPTEATRCTEYLWQRDEGDDWQPCTKGQPAHSGTDFLFALKILEGNL
jgi:hypothetical protein